MINGENIVEGIDLKQRKTIVVLANGSKMECTIREFVVGTRILPPEFQSLKFGKKFNDYLHDLHRKLSMDFYTWACEECNTMHHVEYDSGDEWPVVMARIKTDHQKRGKPDCSGKKIRLVDYRGMERKFDAQLLTSA